MVKTDCCAKCFYLKAVQIDSKQRFFCLAKFCKEITDNNIPEKCRRFVDNDEHQELQKQIKKGLEMLFNTESNEEMAMENTTNNELRNYIFICRYDYGTKIINNADSFKDAVYKLYEYETSIDECDLFKKALEGFSDDDTKGIISLYSHFSNYRIDSVYLIDKKIYNYCEEE